MATNRQKWFYNVDVIPIGNLILLTQCIVPLIGGPAEDLRMRIELLLHIVDGYIQVNSDRAELTEEISHLEKRKKTKTLYISS